MKILGQIALALVVFAGGATARQDGKTVPAAAMRQIYEEVKTPYKYGMVVVPADNTSKIDCPTVFQKGNKWYMTYLVFDGRGYETWLAASTDLLDWKAMGKVLSRSADTAKWDANQLAGYPSLGDTKWGGGYRLGRYNGRRWMSYFGGNVKGYEAGDLSIAIAHTTGDVATAHEWEHAASPVFTARDPGVRWWENRKLFKSTVIRDKQKLTGYPFVMYYNANGDSAVNNVKTRWFERIGMAVSNDMVTWKRMVNDPLVHHPVGITGDPVIQKIGDVWVMFYFGAFWQDRKGAFNRFACSYDLVNWTDWTGENLVSSSEPFDELYAHKSFVVKHKGVVYHFYCAVNKKEQRGIAVATSVDKGKSKLNFIPAGK
ncbi:glycosylase [Hufsiella ginkgonis]|nr:glycosylase [Hufsiella ginkgonis]